MRLSDEQKESKEPDRQTQNVIDYLTFDQIGSLPSNYRNVNNYNI